MHLYRLLLDILLQPSQSLLGLLEYIVGLADGEPQPVLDDRGIRIGEEFSGWDGGHAELLDAEPGELEIAWPVGYVGRERVVVGKLHFGQVDEDEVAAFGLGVLQGPLLVIARKGRKGVQ